MLLGDELCAPALLGLVLLGVLAPDCPAAPLDDVSWAKDKLPAKHTVAKKLNFSSYGYKPPMFSLSASL